MTKPVLIRVMEALDECLNVMNADNEADGWLEIIQNAEQAHADLKKLVESVPDMQRKKNCTPDEHANYVGSIYLAAAIFKKETGK